MKFWSINKTILVIIAFLVIVGIVLGFNNLDIQAVTEGDDYIDLSDGWTIEIGQDTVTDANLETTGIKVIDLAETVTITRPLEDYGFVTTCLHFYSEHALVDVYLDDELIYSYGQDLVATQNSIPKKNHYIPLEEDYPGKTLRIVLTGGRNGAFSNLYAVYITSDITSRRQNSCLSILTCAISTCRWDCVGITCTIATNLDQKRLNR